MMAQLELFFWLTMALFVCQACYLVKCLWPTLRGVIQRLRSRVYRKLHCCWCWGPHLMRWYPQRWSSCMCDYHRELARRQRATRRKLAQSPFSPQEEGKVEEAYREEVAV